MVVHSEEDSQTGILDPENNSHIGQSQSCRIGRGFMITLSNVTIIFPIRVYTYLLMGSKQKCHSQFGHFSI